MSGKRSLARIVEDTEAERNIALLGSVITAAATMASRNPDLIVEVHIDFEE